MVFRQLICSVQFHLRNRSMHGACEKSSQWNRTGILPNLDNSLFYYCPGWLLYGIVVPSFFMDLLPKIIKPCALKLVYPLQQIMNTRVLNFFNRLWHRKYPPEKYNLLQTMIPLASTLFQWNSWSGFPKRPNKSLKRFNMNIGSFSQFPPK